MTKDRRNETAAKKKKGILGNSEMLHSHKNPPNEQFIAQCPACVLFVIACLFALQNLLSCSIQ